MNYEKIRLFSKVTYKDNNEIKEGIILYKFSSCHYINISDHSINLEAILIGVENGYEILYLNDYKNIKMYANKPWCFSNSTRYIEHIFKGIKQEPKKSHNDYSMYNHSNNLLCKMKRDDSQLAIMKLIDTYGFVYIKKDYDVWEKCYDYKFEKGLHGRTYLVTQYSCCRLDRIGKGYKIVKNN